MISSKRFTMLPCAVVLLFVGVCRADGQVRLLSAPTAVTLKSELSGVSFDWSQGSSYVGNVAPEVGAIVSIPDGMDAKLSAADTTSWEFVNSHISRIRPLTGTSRLVVDVSADTATLASEVCWTNRNTSEAFNKGGIVKVGAGELILDAPDPYAYFTVVTVSNGTLTLYRDASDKCYFDSFVVATNATLNTVGGTGITVCHTFFGEGTINGAGTGALQTYSSATDTSVFAGKFTGFGGSFLTIASPVMLTGTNSTAKGTFSISGPMDAPGAGTRLGVLKFSEAVDAESSHGRQRTMHLGASTYPGGVLYLGRGQTTDIEFQGRGTSAGTYSFIDAGAYGGLNLTGIYQCNQKSAAMHREVVLTGSNVVESVCALRFIERSNDVLWCPYHLVKEGSGTWRMREPSTIGNYPLSGGISVEDGTLRYDTLREAGEYCSLGKATYLYERYTGQLSADKSVDWAISLGSTNGTTGTLEYSGEGSVQCATRPIALKGDGRILHNSAHRFRFKGVTSDGANAKTLTLDGTGADDNEIAGISDAGGGALSIAKEGEGRWILGADSSFRGDLSVNGGTLEVRAPATSYTWFRFTDMQVCTNRVGYAPSATPSSTMYMREMGFFNASGVSQTIGLQFNSDWRKVNPGEFTYAKDASATANASHPWSALFDDTAEYMSVSFSAAPVYGDESTWIPIVFRMPANADPIASFDLAYNTSASGAGALYHPAAFKMEGSVDGFTWTELMITNDVVSPGSGYWLKNKTQYSTGDLATKTHTGFTFNPPAVGANPLASATVCVATNATLKAVDGTVGINAFAIDMTAGGGTVDGFAFAENGALKMVNVPAGKSAEVSFTPLNCTGVENLSNWTLYVDGTETTKCHAYVKADGTVRIVPVGFRFTIR